MLTGLKPSSPENKNKNEVEIQGKTTLEEILEIPEMIREEEEKEEDNMNDMNERNDNINNINNINNTNTKTNTKTNTNNINTRSYSGNVLGNSIQELLGFMPSPSQQQPKSTSGVPVEISHGESSQETFKEVGGIRVRDIVNRTILGHMAIQSSRPTSNTVIPIDYKMSEGEKTLRKSLLHSLRYNTFGSNFDSHKSKEDIIKEVDEEGEESGQDKTGDIDTGEDVRNQSERSRSLTGGVDDEDEDGDGDKAMGSIHSVNSTYMKSYYGIREALDETYIPAFIRTTKWIALFILLLFISVSGIIYGLGLRGNKVLEKSINSIKRSEDRHFQLIALALTVKHLVILNM